MKKLPTRVVGIGAMRDMVEWSEGRFPTSSFSSDRKVGLSLSGGALHVHQKIQRFAERLDVSSRRLINSLQGDHRDCLFVDVHAPYGLKLTVQRALKPAETLGRRLGNRRVIRDVAHELVVQVGQGR